jgi:hypothetical protein
MTLTTPPKPLSAIDAASRGWANARANWELVGLQVVREIVVGLLTLLALAIPLVVFAGDVLAALFTATPTTPDDWLDRIAEILSRFAWNEAMFLALFGTLALGLLATLIHCLFQAGTFGVLAAGDRQALPGPSRDHRLFRTYSRAEFFGWGRTYYWRYFWFVNLYGTLAMLLLLFVVSGIVGASAAGQRWGVGTGIGLGCGGTLIAAFLALILWLWGAVAEADLAREEARFGDSMRRALGVVGRRLGAVLALLVFFLVATMIMASVLMPFSLFTSFALKDHFWLRQGVNWLFQFAALLPAVFARLWLSGSLVSLLRSESLLAREVSS